jgi:hypothetical protein
MKTILILIILVLFCSNVNAQSGLQGYISSWPNHTDSSYGEGFGFYSTIWPLIPSPIANFQIGLPSTWILPDNSDNKTIPLCPVGTYARDNWAERGPTWSSVFQTVEGGPGYWAGNRFHYNSPKFKMNSTPSCYDVEISTPGWPFFWSSAPLPDSVLGIAQLSNHILYPPDGMTFEGNANGEFLGISYMSLPLTARYNQNYPVGEKSWTCFLNAENFKGPIAYYLPETWSKISIKYPFDYSRGLDSRSTSTNLAAGTMEINTVPELKVVDSNFNTFYKIPILQFPVDSLNRTVLSKDVRFYNKSALYNKVLSWKNGGSIALGEFDTLGSHTPLISTNAVNYTQDNKPLIGINQLAKPLVINNNEFCFQWTGSVVSRMRQFPQYFKDSANFRVAIDSTMLPSSALSLTKMKFAIPNPKPIAYEAKLKGVWANPGPAIGPFYAYLMDSSMVTYYWYRFIDQPVFQQYNFSKIKKDSLQNLVNLIHKNWTKTKNYMPPLTRGTLVNFDSGLIVTPPLGFEIGYVPIVTKQEKIINKSSIQTFSDKLITSVKIFSNTTTSQFKITTDNVNIKLVEVYNILGRLVYQSQPNSTITIVDLSSEINGIFFIKITDNNQTITTEKIVIQ